VEHTCYRCHADIPEGTAFCPHCGAPQIRVALPEGDMQPGVASPESGQPSASAAPNYWAQPGPAYPAQAGAIQWQLAWKGALLGGLAAAALTAIPFVSIGFLVWMLGAGALSVSLYRRQLPGMPITPGMGMKLGALAGVFAFLANAVVATLSFVALRSSGNLRSALQEQMQKQMSGNSDPKMQQMMQNMLDWISTPQGAATLLALFLVISGVICLLLTAAGGAIAASMGQRRESR
jgi:hypothetical protein